MPQDNEHLAVQLRDALRELGIPTGRCEIMHDTETGQPGVRIIPPRARIHWFAFPVDGHYSLYRGRTLLGTVGTRQNITPTEAAHQLHAAMVQRGMFRDVAPPRPDSQEPR